MSSSYEVGGQQGSAAIVLTERDHMILRVIYEHGFARVEDLVALFRGEKIRECRKRLRELTRAGYLSFEHDSVFGRKVLLRLTRFGVATVAARYPLPLPYPYSLSKMNLQHDAVLCGVRVRLQKLWALPFIPERAIKRRDYERVPDGFFIRQDQSLVALEIENSSKGSRRFLNLLSIWDRYPDVGQILYVATTDHLFRELSAYVDTYTGPKEVCVIHLDQVLSGELVTVTVKGRAHSLLEVGRSA